MKEENSLIQSVDRALGLLEYIAEHPEGGFSLAELTEHMNMDKSSVFRILATLMKHRLVRQEENRKSYRLGYGVFSLASSLYHQMKITQVASPVLRGVARKTRENAHLAARSGPLAVFIDREQGSNIITANTNIGDTEELFCTAVGKSLICDFSFQEIELLFAKHPLERYTPQTITELPLLLQELSRVRSQGYALDIEEYNLNVVCVGGPIYDFTGKIVAALGISGPKDRMMAEMERNLRIVREALGEINALMGRAPGAEAGTEV